MKLVNRDNGYRCWQSGDLRVSVESWYGKMRYWTQTYNLKYGWSTGLNISREQFLKHLRTK